MAAPILPTADALVTAAIDAMVAARPSTLAHFNNPNSYYSALPIMWRAQALIALRRLADEVKSRRLRFAAGDALRSLAASEFGTTLPSAPQLSYATLTLTRPAGAAPTGIIRSGSDTQFVKVAQPDGIALPAANAYPLPIAAATYNVIAPVYVAAGQLTTTVQCVAVTTGAGANVPVFTNAGYALPSTIQPSKPLFDPTFTVNACTSAGGSSGLTDDVLRAAARATIVGQFGPTDGALLASALEQQSVRHVAAFRANAVLPYAQVYIADESWASCTAWASQVAQFFASNWQGFGCRARFGTVTNLQIAIAPTIVLASTDALNYTQQIDANVRAAAFSYFSDRPDWYTWRLQSLRAAISRSDPRILVCSNVVVSDAVTGGALGEPVSPFPGTSVFQTTFAPAITHYFPTSQNIQATYLPPS